MCVALESAPETSGAIAFLTCGPWLCWRNGITNSTRRLLTWKQPETSLNSLAYLESSGKILAALGELYQAYKNESQAQQAFARAAHVVQSLAGRMEDEQHRTTFLSAQQVRAVLAHAATERGREMKR